MGFTKLFLFFFFLVSNPSQSYAAENVSVTLYYETLCPYCADFIVNHLAKIFQNVLISIVNLRMVPWGNAWLNSDFCFACQVSFLKPPIAPPSFIFSYSLIVFQLIATSLSVTSSTTSFLVMSVCHERRLIFPSFKLHAHVTQSN
ncbi:putative gamma interferon inducible lysosomal thiol reductase GILT [Rosa chinensis]|uniref:Putative gamma interferon inducible lysosomal thiol reductase GILT n=1 Tax=Rosa chinensis TaxID=74649 RepID=A0A2P6R8R8_ROSCH|nr:putative gamma interferon inducible lysosomal thiol reductase GILT [Rosa chinensis]